MFLQVQSFFRPAASQILTRVSTAANGAQANEYSEEARFSPDGRYMLFSSAASNLVGDSNGTGDIFLKNMISGEVTLVSRGVGGAPGDVWDYTASFSPDGRFIIFSSDSDNIIAGDNKNVDDVFVRDLATGAITLISGQGNTAGNGDSSEARFNPDGKFVVFASNSTNLDSRDTDASPDIYLKNLVTGAVTLLTVTPNSTKLNGSSDLPEFSPDGRYVLFKSSASNLVKDANDFAEKIFLKNLATGEITLISATEDNVPANGFSNYASFSADGRYVIFDSNATNLIGNDRNGEASDIYRKDLVTGAVTLLSTNSAGEQANSYSSMAQLSRDGRYLMFESLATNLVANDTNNKVDVFLKDLVTGQVTILSARPDGTQGDNDSGFAVLSPDGRYVVFESLAKNLVGNDTNNARDLFRVDLSYKANEAAIAEGRMVEAVLSVGAASSVTIAWGDGASTTLAPVQGRAALNHAYATTGIKAATISLVEGALTWSVAHTIDVGGGTMVRNTALADTLAGGSGRDVLDGDGTADVLLGGGNNDRLKAYAGNDRLDAGSGNDALYGGTGNDRLIGGTGKDTLTGNTGRDVFVFDDRETGSSKSRADYITDFSGRRGDRIDLKLIDANTKKRGDQKFSFIGDEESFSKAGEVRFEKTKSATYVYLNTDNDRAAEAVIKLKGSIELSKSWFVL